IICASWKWQGDRKVESISVSPSNPTNDKPVLQKLLEVMNEADAVVAHNGDKFDMRWIRARLAFHRLPPLPPVVQIDTKKIAKSAFYFNSNRLEYLARYLGLGSKVKTGGYGLWKKCMNGDKTALEKMVRYNKHDVTLLEDVFDVLYPHV